MGADTIEFFKRLSTMSRARGHHNMSQQLGPIGVYCGVFLHPEWTGEGWFPMECHCHIFWASSWQDFGCSVEDEAWITKVISQCVLKPACRYSLDILHILLSNGTQQAVLHRDKWLEGPTLVYWVELNKQCCTGTRGANTSLLSGTQQAVLHRDKWLKRGQY